MLKKGGVWGLGLGLAIVSWIHFLTMFDLGLTDLTWIGTFILVIIFTAAFTHFSGNAGTTRAIILAVLTLAGTIIVARVVFQVYMYGYITLIDPSWVETAAAEWRARLTASNVDVERINLIIADFENQWRPGYIFSIGIIRYAAPQFILSVITWAIWRLIGKGQNRRLKS